MTQPADDETSPPPVELEPTPIYDELCREMWPPEETPCPTT